MASEIIHHYKIQSSLELGESKNYILASCEEIFFESSVRKKFETEADRKSFLYSYFGYYLENFPELFYVAYQQLNDQPPKVLGYICGCPDTLNEPALLIMHSYLNDFKEDYPSYPAHLHINCHRDSRGMGVGSALIKTLENSLKSQNIPGLHLITSEDAQNVSFYEKNGYNHRTLKDNGGFKILLLGKTL